MEVQGITTPADPIIRALQLQDEIFHHALEGITDGQALLRPNDQTNHYNWLLGHVATCRYMLANAIGLPLENPDGDLYFKSIGPYAYRPLTEIQTRWEAVSVQLMPFLENLSPEALNAQVPGMPVSHLDLIVFYQYHEAYHLGQMGILRKVIGLNALQSN